MQLPTQTVPTMSSLELVDIINALRKPGQPKIAHRSLLRRVENHPGITSAQFCAHVLVDIGNGAKRKSKCYNLPKRECELLVMAESLEVQTRVYDRMVELEQSQGLLAGPAAQQQLADLQAQVTELSVLLSYSKPDFQPHDDYAGRESILERRDAAFRKIVGPALEARALARQAAVPQLVAPQVDTRIDTRTLPYDTSPRAKYSDLLHVTYDDLPNYRLQEGQFLVVNGVSCVFLDGTVWASVKGISDVVGLEHKGQRKIAFVVETARLLTLPMPVTRRKVQIVPLQGFVNRLAASTRSYVRSKAAGAGFVVRQLH